MDRKVTKTISTTVSLDLYNEFSMLQLQVQADANQRVAQAAYLAALVKLGQSHRDELVQHITKGANTSDE